MKLTKAKLKSIVESVVNEQASAPKGAEVFRHADEAKVKDLEQTIGQLQVARSKSLNALYFVIDSYAKNTNARFKSEKEALEVVRQYLSFEGIRYFSDSDLKPVVAGVYSQYKDRS